MRSNAVLPAVLFLLGFQAAAGVAIAGLPHAASWTHISDDGKYVLVMVSPLPVDEDARSGFLEDKRVRPIRAKYSQSGLYRNDGSTTPLWTIDYFSRHEVHIAPDGEHLVVGAKDWFVGAFYAKGKRLAGYGYSLSELVSFMRLKSLMSFRWPSCVWTNFDAYKLTYTVRTNQGEVFVFDVTTGTLIDRRSPWPLHFGLALVSVVAALGFATVLIARRVAGNECGHPRNAAGQQRRAD